MIFNNDATRDFEKSVCLIFCLVLSIIIYLCLPEESRNLSGVIHLLSAYITIFGIIEVLLRAAELSLQKIAGLYKEGILESLIKSFSERSKIVLLLSFTVAVITRGSQENSLEWALQHKWDISVLCLSFVYVLFKGLRLSQQSLSTCNLLKTMDGLDCGTALACMYYHGYLRIILPSTGRENKGLLEKMENYEDRENVTFSVKKFFIMIPRSMHTPPDLAEAAGGWMEAAKKLEAEVVNRCGVKGRTYQNTVYKIRAGGVITADNPPVYVVAEGATPLMTFYEIQSHLHRYSVTYKKHCKGITEMFYRTLKELLDNDPDCRHLCELVYYKDYDDSGQRVNLAKVILDRINDIKRQGS